MSESPELSSTASRALVIEHERIVAEQADRHAVTLESILAILRSARTGKARLDGAEIQLQRLVELRIRRVVGAEEMLFPGVLLNQFHERIVATGEAQVSSSIGKRPAVAPYSGAILAMVARSARPRLLRPVP